MQSAVGVGVGFSVVVVVVLVVVVVVVVVVVEGYQRELARDIIKESMEDSSESTANAVPKTSLTILPMTIV
jgi:uncharacterized membrane protein